MAADPPDSDPNDRPVVSTELDPVIRCLTAQTERLHGLQTQLLGLIGLFPSADVRWLYRMIEREVGRNVSAIQAELLSVTVSLIMSARAPRLDHTPQTQDERIEESRQGTKVLGLISLLLGRTL